MKRLYRTLLLILSLGIFSSCLIDNETDLDMNDKGSNLATFNKNAINLTALANGSEYQMDIQLKLVGPSVADLTGDITVTVARAASSTAIEGVHYKFASKTIVLKKADNYFANLGITLLTEGNTPPMDDTPEYLDYKAPILDLVISTATGESTVVPSGKKTNIVLNYTPPNPYAGDYDVTIKYFHPTAGGSYPNDPYGGLRTDEKTLTAVTGRKCETGFSIWPDTDLCWITILSDNSVVFTVDDTWPYDVKSGDPNNANNISHYDPATGKIYLYYYYAGTGGNRIFWEVLTPKN